TDPDTRELYRHCFDLAGCTVIEASDGRDALAKALGHAPSLVVAELRLPFIDGVALCGLLRLDSSTTNVPILIVTADKRPTQIAQAQRSGADAVLTKPTLPEDMLEASMALLKQPRGARHSSVDSRPTPTVMPIGERRMAMSKAHRRFDTVSPPAPPPELVCPSCDRVLNYDHSHVGGVSDRNAEQWDYYDCPTCGTFQHRQLTRRLRHIHS
ncbi:MAG TPA: response regulator, partial [Vicinamibacterales bacterium]|nr:response regulator [Vicinamibacterales bacterium]